MELVVPSMDCILNSKSRLKYLIISTALQYRIAFNPQESYIILDVTNMENIDASCRRAPMKALSGIVIMP